MGLIKPTSKASGYACHLIYDIAQNHDSEMEGMYGISLDTLKSKGFKCQDFEIVMLGQTLGDLHGENVHVYVLGGLFYTKSYDSFEAGVDANFYWRTYNNYLYFSCNSNTSTEFERVNVLIYEYVG